MTKHMTFPAPENAPVFALHSSASHSGQWNSFRADLEGRYDVITPDLPGYGAGGSFHDFADADMGSIAAPIIKQMARYNQPVHLVGHSFGGAVALKIALTRPDLVKSLTIYEPAAFHFLAQSTPEDQALLASLTAVSEALNIEAATGRPDVGMKVFVDFWNEDGIWDNLPERNQQKLSGLAPSVASDFKRSFSESWALEELHRMNIPTLVMLGMDSPAIAQRVAHLVAKSIPEARLAILPELGHMAPATAPQWVNPRILDHIAHTERPVRHFTWPMQLAA